MGHEADMVPLVFKFLTQEIIGYSASTCIKDSIQDMIHSLTEITEHIVFCSFPPWFIITHEIGLHKAPIATGPGMSISRCYPVSRMDMLLSWKLASLVS